MIGRLFFTRQSLVWFILIAITLASWVAGHAGMATATNGGIVLLLAFTKVGIVVWDFMEVRHAPLWLKTVTGVWLIGAAILLIAMSAFVR